MLKWILTALAACVLAVVFNLATADAGPLPNAVHGQDGGYPVTVTGTVTATPTGVQAVQGQDAGYPVAITGTISTTGITTVQGQDGGFPVRTVPGGAECAPGSFGEVLVLASAATAVPASPTAARKGMWLCNSGPNEIRCGCGSSSSSVTTATGWPVTWATSSGSGGCVWVPGETSCHCRAKTADQVTTAATNYQECL